MRSGVWPHAPVGVLATGALLQSPVSRSVAIALKRQSGAIAFGSLVLTLVWFIKWALRYMAKRLKQATGDNKLVKFLVCCCMVRPSPQGRVFDALAVRAVVASVKHAGCVDPSRLCPPPTHPPRQCCVSCFECCIKFMERQAYIEMAIFGGGFCASAKRAYHLVARNALRLVAVNSVRAMHWRVCGGRAWWLGAATPGWRVSHVWRTVVSCLLSCTCARVRVCVYV